MNRHNLPLAIICQMASQAVGQICALLIVVPSIVRLMAVLLSLAMNWAFCTSGLHRMIGSCDESIHPLDQSILGCVSANHG